MDRPNEDEVNAATNTLRRWAACEVDDIVSDIKQSIDNGDITDMEELNEQVHERVDNDQCVIYTYKAMQMTVFGEADPDTYLDDVGSGGLIWSDGVNWSLLSYSVMYQDVLKGLERAGIDEGYMTMMQLKDEPCYYCDKPIDKDEPVEYIERSMVEGGRTHCHLNCPDEDEEGSDGNAK